MWRSAYFVLIHMKDKRVQIDTSTSRLPRIVKTEFYKMEVQTINFLESFRFDGKIVMKRKISHICMGETVPYKKNV